jgi:hypothetical protein
VFDFVKEMQDVPAFGGNELRNFSHNTAACVAQSPRSVPMETCREVQCARKVAQASRL